jgi:integrase
MRASRLYQHLDDYLQMRAALGHKLTGERPQLRAFLAFLAAQDVTGPITTSIALEWACQPPGTRTRGHRLSTLRGFLSYLKAAEPRTEVPAVGLIRWGSRPTPYIYSSEEIEGLLRAASQLGGRTLEPCGDSGRFLRPITFRTLIGLLVSTGLRLLEALRLDMKDVRLLEDPPSLAVRRTKFGKTRIVPIHPSVAGELGDYIQRREQLGYSRRSPALFVSEHRTRLSRETVWRTWRILLARTGVRWSPDPPRPTLHALRHTFAVRRLVAWQEQRVDVAEMLPHLSVYMGHTEPRYTYWYLSATPELLAHAGQTFAEYAHQEVAR